MTRFCPCIFYPLTPNGEKIQSSFIQRGDQGFLNKIFPWWHRWPSKLNHLKLFPKEHDKQHRMPKNLYTIHYLGMKPWMCYMDYDCNWDMSNHHHFASDDAHRRWWQVYKAMPRRLPPHCGLAVGMDKRMRRWRGRAREANLPDGHWKIKVKTPRKHHF